MKRVFSLMMAAWIVACSGGGGGTKSAYEKKLDQAGATLADGDYSAALDQFTDAVNSQPDRAAGYAGQGWCYFKLDALSDAEAVFSQGASKTAPPADLFAGWGFVLNAQKAYALSNTKAASALSTDTHWEFSYGSELDWHDLRILKAENYFLLHDYPASLTEVKVVDPAFSADVSGASGVAELAARIEQLRQANKRLPQ